MDTFGEHKHKKCIFPFLNCHYWHAMQQRLLNRPISLYAIFLKSFPPFTLSFGSLYSSIHYLQNSGIISKYSSMTLNIEKTNKQTQNSGLTMKLGVSAKNLNSI